MSSCYGVPIYVHTNILNTIYYIHYYIYIRESMGLVYFYVCLYIFHPRIRDLI